MNTSVLQDLGMTVRQTKAGIEADLDLVSLSLMNPVTRKLISRVSFNVVNDRLVVSAPPELLGSPPLGLTRIEKASDLEQQLLEIFNEQVSHLQRRSADVQALGLSPKVDAETLELSAEVQAGPYVFIIATDKRGNFRVARAERNGVELTMVGPHQFELSEFRERGALASYLTALFGEVAPRSAAMSALANTSPSDRPVTFAEVVRSFGPGALLPAASSLEILVELKVKGERYRFAAARVVGRTFRGLLAGPSGKVWAERFDVGQFPGVAALVAELLSVPPESVELLTPGEGA